MDHTSHIFFIIKKVSNIQKSYIFFKQFETIFVINNDFFFDKSAQLIAKFVKNSC